MVILLALSNHLQLADLRQIKESKPTGRIWYRMVLDGGLISSKISVIWETLMIPTQHMLNAFVSALCIS